MLTLKEIYDNFKYPDGNGDKGTAHTYIDVYENILKPYRENGDILEIGVAWGYSISMWREYFIKGSVTGIDIEIVEKAEHLLNNKNINIIKHDATKDSVIEVLGEKKFDIIIDDGSHNIKDQINSFNILKNFIKKNGLYIIEDIIDINSSKNVLESLHHNCEIIDNRNIKNRYDDVLVIYRF